MVINIFTGKEINDVDTGSNASEYRSDASESTDSVINESMVDDMVERLNNAAKWVEDYYSSNEDNPVADYLTWGWEESDRDEIYDRLERDLRSEAPYDKKYERCLDLLEKALAKAGDDKGKLAETIIEASDLEYINSIRSVDCEVFSMNIGEIEEQDDDLFSEFMKLTPVEQEEVSRLADVCFYQDINGKYSDYFYLCMDYERWGMICNVERLIDELEAHWGVF